MIWHQLLSILCSSPWDCCSNWTIGAKAFSCQKQPILTNRASELNFMSSGCVYFSSHCITVLSHKGKINTRQSLSMIFKLKEIVKRHILKGKKAILNNVNIMISNWELGFPLGAHWGEWPISAPQSIIKTFSQTTSGFPSVYIPPTSF